ncbi:MAG: hypothetical protein AAGN82_20045 [Myxococcota bacterium]
MAALLFVACSFVMGAENLPFALAQTAPEPDDAPAGDPSVDGPPAAGAPAAGAAPSAAPSPPSGETTPDGGAAPPADGSPPAGSEDAPPTPSSTTAPEPSAPPAVDGATYAVRLRDLQQRIDQLKEQIRRSHTRLSLLSDTILAGGGSGARAGLSLQNKFSNQFRLTRALVVLDGAVQYNKQDLSGALHKQKNIPVFNGSIPPGDHTVQVLIKLRGYGYGVFSYLRGYEFEVRSSHSFTAVEGKTTRLRILAYEKGGVTTKLEDRPAVRFLETVTTGLVDANGQPAN